MSDYQVYVSASPMLMRDDPSLPHALMHIAYTIRSTYESSDRSSLLRISGHYSEQRFECAPFVSTDSSPSSTSWGFISFTLDNLLSPFPLDRLRWIDPDSREDLARDEVMSKILKVAHRVVNDPRNKGRKRFGISVDIIKVITLLENEIQEMSRSLMEASMRRDIHDMLRRSEAASESAIQNLEKVAILKHRDSSEVCAICLEEPVTGDVVSRVGCCHEFHSSCIEKWLKIAHTCPTCRHKLPPL